MKKSITINLDGETLERLGRVADKLTVGFAVIGRKCINAGLPEVEREFGIETEVVKNGKRKVA